MSRARYTTLAEINVTSLVDVSLVLLIIFMITAPLLQSGMEVNLPRADADELQAKEGIVVVITAGGRCISSRSRSTVTHSASG